MKYLDPSCGFFEEASYVHSADGQPIGIGHKVDVFGVEAFEQKLHNGFTGGKSDKLVSMVMIRAGKALFLCFFGKAVYGFYKFLYLGLVSYR